MRFYNHPHAFYCGVDLHARSMFTHILDSQGATVFEGDLPSKRNWAARCITCGASSMPSI